MAGYYNPYTYINNPYAASYQPNNAYGTFQNQSMAPAQMQSQQYMINVDGEMAARAWPMPNNISPNTIIPLWDLDGQHVYFRSVDAYGRMNPLRKGRVVFEDEQQNLPEGNQSGAVQPAQNFVAKEDLDSLKQEIREIREMMKAGNPQGNNQNGNRNNRGDNR